MTLRRVESTLLRGDDAPYHELVTNTDTYRVKRSPAAKNQILRIVLRLKGGKEDIQEIGVAPGGFYVAAGGNLTILPTPPGWKGGQGAK